MKEVDFIVDGVGYKLVFISSITPDEYRIALYRGDTILDFGWSEDRYQTPWLAVDRLLGDLITTSRYTRGDASKSLFNRIEELKTVLDGLETDEIRHEVIKIEEFEENGHEYY